MNNILKAYSSTVQRNIDFDTFINNKPDTWALANQTSMTILLNDGTRMLFRAVEDIEDAYKLAGLVFQHIDFIGSFDQEVKYYLLSRIRG